MVNKSVLTYSKNRRQFSYFKGWNLNWLLPRYDKKNINTMEIWSSRRFEIGEKKCQFSRVLNSLTGEMNFNAQINSWKACVWLLLYFIDYGKTTAFGKRTKFSCQVLGNLVAILVWWKCAEVSASILRTSFVRFQDFYNSTTERREEEKQFLKVHRYDYHYCAYTPNFIVPW